jgi:hypothetical protein
MKKGKGISSSKKKIVMTDTLPKQMPEVESFDERTSLEALV